MIILWNPSIRKSIGITLPGELGWSDEDYYTVFGFGVCPVSRDPIVVKCKNLDEWKVEIFTLSSGIWKAVPSRSLPSCEWALLTWDQVVIDRFIYFLTDPKIVPTNLKLTKLKVDTYSHMIVSFDMTTKEFTILNLPDCLKHFSICLTLSKIRESLLVVHISDVDKWDCDVWMMMEQGLTKSFTKLITIYTPVTLVLGFKKNGDPIIVNEDPEDDSWVLNVYESCSQHVNNLGIYADDEDSFFMGSYMETLLLLDHPDCFIY